MTPSPVEVCFFLLFFFFRLPFRRDCQCLRTATGRLLLRSPSARLVQLVVLVQRSVESTVRRCLEALGRQGKGRRERPLQSLLPLWPRTLPLSSTQSYIDSRGPAWGRREHAGRNQRCRTYRPHLPHPPATCPPRKPLRPRYTTSIACMRQVGPTSARGLQRGFWPGPLLPVYSYIPGVFCTCSSYRAPIGSHETRFSPRPRLVRPMRGATKAANFYLGQPCQGIQERAGD